MKKDCFVATRRLRAALLTSSALALAWALPATPSHAASDGTWLTSPGSNDYGNGANWDGGFVPVGTASFGTSNTTSLVISNASVGGWTFNAGASNYTFDVSNSLNFTGAGITVNGGSATITNNNYLQFFGTSTAGDATITNTSYGTLYFYNSSTAGNAALINNAGGVVNFDYAVGVNNDGKMSAGSIAGAGSYVLGSNELTVGSNNLSTEVSGVISGSGSLVKTGTGTMILTGANTYTGGTTVNGGQLLIGNFGGVSGSIVGAVTVGSGATLYFLGDTSGITTISNNGWIFYHSSAGSATITNNANLVFAPSSTAGNATITNNGGLQFFDSAGSATITNNGNLYFISAATAGSATITNNSVLQFSNDSTAGSATIANNGSAYMYFYNSSTAGNAAITNNNWLSFNETSTAASATLTNNRWLYFYNNSTAGSATITTSNLLVFRDNSSAGNASITNTNTINFVVSSTAGSAVITNNSGGTTTFQDNATAGNAQLINNAANAVFDFSGSTGPNGDHKLSAGSIAGNGTFSLGANELTVGGNNLSTTVSGVIADGGASGGTGGSLVKSGTGTLTLSATNTYTGGTTLAGGTVSVSSEANLGDVAGGLTFNGGTLQITGTTFNAITRSINWGADGGTLDIANAANNFTISQNLGGGALTKSGAGTLTLTGADNFSGVTVSAGTLAFLDTTAGSTTITNNAQLAFYGHSTAGSAVITNSGNVLFDGDSTAGSAQLINSGSSAVINFWTPGPASDGRITAGSIAGSGRFDLNSSELTVGSNNLSTVATGVLTGDGLVTGTSLIKTGTGTLTLSGTNTYSGATVVNDGALVVNGSIAASSGVAVNNSGTLGGGGTVGSTTVDAGGTLAAGNGTANSSLNVAGSLALQSGAFYMVQINPATSSFASVTGTATLGGSTLKAVYASGSYVAKQYTILTAGGVNGTFGSVVQTNLPSNFHTTVSYDATHAYLNLILSFIAPPGSGLSGNQHNVGNAIINSFNKNGGISLVYSGLTATGLTQASGETAAGSQQTTFQAMGQFMGLLTDPFSTGRETDTSAPPAYADSAPAGAARDAYAMLTKAPSFEQRWSVWAAGFGGSQTTDGNTVLGSNSATSRLFGTAAGAEYAFSPQTRAGFALAGGGTSFAVAGGGSGRSDLFEAGVYVRHTNGPSYITAALAYGWQDVTTDRTVTLAGVDRLRAEFNANTWSGRVEGGYRFVAPWAGGIGLTPYTAGQFTSFDLPAYTETVVSGSNAFALAYAAKSVTDTRSELGLRTDKSFALQNAVLTLRGRAAWAHDFNPDRIVAATFQALPGASFVVSGARPAADSALTTASAEMKWLNGWSAAASFEGEFSNVTRSYAGNGVVRYAW